jgi:uncharacterized Zn finger protein (UPF0148 family)
MARELRDQNVRMYMATCPCCGFAVVWHSAIGTVECPICEAVYHGNGFVRTTSKYRGNWRNIVDMKRQEKEG